MMSNLERGIGSIAALDGESANILAEIGGML
jgi:hypothetical protein